MKYETPLNPNYVATIIEVKEVHELAGLDNLVSISAFGYQALVSKDTKPGDIGVLFTAESQLSEEFARMNNLHRHTDRNNNEKEAGYLEDSRRVKAIKLRGWRSDALFMSLDAFKYLKLKPEDFTVGDVFDKIGDHEIVKKYLLKEPGIQNGPKARIRRVDVKAFPPHVDTVNFYRNENQIPDDAQIIVTQKLHGSSGRWGRVPIERDLKWHEKLAQKFGVIVSTHKMATVAGSRMVVKSIDGEAEIGKQSFYSSDLWSEWAAKINDSIPEGFVVYGELVGYTSDGKEIQRGYTYDLMPGNSDLYIYRIAIISPQGRIVDLSWPEVRSFATSAGFKHVPEIATLRHDEFNPEVYMDSNFYNDWSDNEVGSFVDVPVRLVNPQDVDEGVVVRYDGPNGIFLTKAKSPVFLQKESQWLDKGIIDIESEES